MNKIIYDANETRYQLANSLAGASYNWLFFPGGPGINADYLQTLATNLALPGKTWLIDMPGNGDNFSEHVKAEYDFNKWDTIFMDAVKRFDNPILVGHSFAGMYPLLFPELEQILQGFVILNSAPSLSISRRRPGTHA
ncbi:MAG: alpha/beta fold hydrolase [Gammaproteobacteria bacterium]|nr:alpha/beta fold hydrolase [Gammaproteobacteria bacterium]